MMRRIFSISFVIIWLGLLTYYVHYSFRIDLPNNGDSCCYLNDLKYVISRYLHTAKKSLFIASFGITDKDIAEILHTKDLPIKIAFDTKETNLIPSQENIELVPHTKQGLMHKKVIGIDHEWVMLGSTNLTPLALKMHNNLIICIHSKELHSAIEENQYLKTDSFTYYPMPSLGKLALQELITLLNKANHRIYLCIYTFTHPNLIDALIQAHNRGVDVQIYMDRGMASGACKKSVAKLKESKLFLATQVGTGLLHHKCAIIDDFFVFGSANWTKAAFTKNEEYILFLPSVPPAIKSFFITLKGKSLPL